MHEVAYLCVALVGEQVHNRPSSAVPAHHSWSHPVLHGGGTKHERLGWETTGRIRLTSFSLLVHVSTRFEHGLHRLLAPTVGRRSQVQRR